MSLPNEAEQAEIFQRINAGMKKVHKAPPNTLDRRSQHPKGHGVVQATFEVHDVPEEYRVGVFAQPQSFAAWIRFSNGRVLDDSKPDVHGMAIKLLGVPGEKLATDEASITTHDFVLSDYPVFFAKNAAHFLEFIALKGAQGKELQQAKADGKSDAELAQLMQQQGIQFVTAFPVTRETFTTASSPLTLDYFSQTPYRLGDLVVKYFVKSIKDNPPQVTTSQPAGENHLAAAMRQALTVDKRAAKFEFGVEVQTDPASMPIDDATVAWNSPVRTILATITIPPQDFSTEEHQRLESALSFTPWRTLPEHQPLGSLNQARRQPYADSSITRHTQKAMPREEPSVEEFNRLTLVRFYDCFSNGDYRGMQSCLHPNVEFDDVGFDVSGKEVGAMWHMIVSKGIAVKCNKIWFENGQWTANWECDYEFRARPDSHPNPVHNVVTGTFEFEGGLIRKHHDACDFWNWFEQAMGLKGKAIHLFDFVEGKLESLLQRDVPIDVERKVRAEVKKTAKEKIAAFVKQHPQ